MNILLCEFTAAVVNHSTQPKVDVTLRQEDLHVVRLRSTLNQLLLRHHLTYTSTTQARDVKTKKAEVRYLL